MVPFSPGILLLPLFVCGILAVSRRDHEDFVCGENEQYRGCSGCEPSCKDPNPVCTMNCKPPKCQCSHGFFRSDEGRCVTEFQCVVGDADGPKDVVEPLHHHHPHHHRSPRPHYPPPHHYTHHPRYPPPHHLPGRTPLPHVHLPERPEVCNKTKKQCGVNERYFDEHQCGTACEPSCLNPHPRYCAKLCVQNVCQCENGYVRHPLSKKCVPKSECPIKYPICGVNEEYSGGSKCDPACDGQPECTMEAVVKCRCLPGFVRGSSQSSNCIPKNQCRNVSVSICGENEVYEQGIPCEPTCDDPEMSHRFCTENLVTKCRCLPGFVRGSSGKCVPQSHCPLPVTCPSPNEKYAECGKECEPSCENPKPNACIMRCIKGCLCLPGFVRHPSGKCVPLSYCPLPVENLPSLSCPANEKYAECGKQCEPSCKHPKPNGCIMRCIKGCLCLPGFVRHPTGKCVPLSYCPEPTPECPRNETYVEGGSVCDERTCENPQKKPFRCYDYFTGCQCSPGFVRNKESGKCIRVDHCPAPKPVCPKHEVWIDHGIGCEPTCIKPRISPYCNSMVGGCTCKPGTVRNFDRQCVPESECGDSVIRSGDQTFRLCCTDHRLPEEYLPLCNYTATIEITKLMIEYLSPNKSPRDRSSAVDVASTVLKCFIGEKDVSECCRGKGVKESCLPICSAALYDISKGVSQVNPLELLECLNLGDARPKDVAQRLLKLAQSGTECFAEANAKYLNLH